MKKNIQHIRKRNLQTWIEDPISKKENRTLKVPDALILGAIPFLAYGLLYSYEFSYLNYYNVPSRFINYDIAEIVISSLVIIFIINMAFSLVNGFYIFTNSITSRTGKIFIMIYCVFILLSLLFAYTYLRTNDIFSFRVVIGVVLFSLTIFLIPPFFIIKEKMSYSERFTRYYNRGSEYEANNIKIGMFSTIVELGGALSFLYLFIYLLVGQFGLVAAYTEEYYYELSIDQANVVVYTNPDRVIVKNIDATTNAFEEGYSIYYFTDLKRININYKYFGRLKSKPISTTPSLPTNIPVPTDTSVPTIAFTPTP